MRSRSVVGLAFHTLIVVLWVSFLGALAFIWSLGQTIDLTSVALMDVRWGIFMGLVIQLGPQVFLALSGVSESGNQRLMWLGSFWLFSGVDALTNIGALLNQYESTPTAPVAAIVGIVVAVSIVFAEEVIAHALSILADNVARLWKAFGGDPPEWLYITGEAMSRIGVGSMFSTSKQRRDSGRQRPRATASVSQRSPAREMDIPPESWGAARPIRENREAGNSGEPLTPLPRPARRPG